VLFETGAVSTPAMPLTLRQNHPNPFNPSTTIEYYLPEAAVVTLDVYSADGKLVARLARGERQERGTHTVCWSGLDGQGSAVSSGVYFYRLQAGKETLSRKMVLMR
jgi:flagellar hook assembly protein FlgD